MPIPLLFIGIEVIGAAMGTGISIKAAKNQKEANKINQNANDIVLHAAQKLNVCRKNSGYAIKRLGNRKMQILDESIRPFVDEFKKIGNIKITESKGLNELNKMKLNKENLATLEELHSMTTMIAKGMAPAAVTGVVTAFGAYGVVGTLATASTGTTALSGGAAANATLAFFGGGALTIGGMGATAGAAILGGLVAGPALTVLGIVANAKTSANRNRAYSNLSKAKKLKEEMDVASAMCIGIRKRSVMFDRFLLSLNATFESLLDKMTKIIKDREVDFDKFSPEDIEVVKQALSLAGAIKSILDTPILDSDGKLIEIAQNLPEIENLTGV